MSGLPVFESLSLLADNPNTLRTTYHPQTNANNVLYLPLQDWDLGIATPIIAKDSSRYSCAFTGTTWGAYGRAMDGDDFINLNNLVTPLAATTVGTISVWAKLTSVSGAVDQSLVSFSDTNAVEIIYLHFNTANRLEATCYDGGVQQWSVSLDALGISANTFFRFTLTQNGTTPTLRLNGVTPAQTFSVSTDKTKWFAACTGIDNGRIGVNHVNNGDSAWFTGTAGEVVIWNDVRTDAEDTNDYLATKEYFGL